MDWNRDGKIDVQDYVLYREVISSEKSSNSVPIGITQGIIPCATEVNAIEIIKAFKGE